MCVSLYIYRDMLNRLSGLYLGLYNHYITIMYQAHTNNADCIKLSIRKTLDNEIYF